MTTYDYDAIVIGSGFGGISSALMLQSHGLKVALIEALDAIGGRAYVERREGFQFDRGPSIITVPFLFDDLFALSGSKRENYVKFQHLDTYYDVAYNDGTKISHHQNFDDFLSSIATVSPDDIPGVKKFFAHTHRIFESGFLDYGDRLFKNPLSMLSIGPKMIQLNAVRTAYSLVSKYVKNSKVRELLSFHPLLIGGNPFRAAGIFSLINRLERAYGIWHAVGGVSRLAQGLHKRFTELGGVTFLSTPVEEVSKNERGEFCITTKHQTLTAQQVVCNADMQRFTTQTLAPALRKSSWTKRMTRAKPSMSAFLLYLGTNKQWPNVAQHTICLGPRYKSLLDDIFVHFKRPKDFSYYLHVPTRTDPSLAPAGGEVIYALVPVSHLASQKAPWTEDYEHQMVKALKEHMEANFFPGLQESIVVESRFTPLDFEQTLQSHQGNAFGLEPYLLQSAGFRPANRSAEVPGLYFAGASTQPGAGLPGVVLSARVACQALLEDRGVAHKIKKISELPGAREYCEGPEVYLG